MAINTFAIEHRPDAGSECPMLDFTEPISSGELRSLQNTSAIEFTSCGSPTCKNNHYQLDGRITNLLRISDTIMFQITNLSPVNITVRN